jgi:hypothetical protein
MGAAGRSRVERDFGFAAQASRYQRLFERLVVRSVPVSHTRPDFDETLGEASLRG